MLSSSSGAMPATLRFSIGHIAVPSLFNRHLALCLSHAHLSCRRDLCRPDLLSHHGRLFDAPLLCHRAATVGSAADL